MGGSIVGWIGCLVAGLLVVGRIEAAPPIETYGSLPGLEMAALSPSGNRIALVGMYKDRRRLMITDSDRKLITTVEVSDHKLRGLYWAGDDKLLIRVSRTVPLGFGFTTSKAELSSVLVVSVGGTPPWLVFQKDDRITGGVRGYYGAVERQGRWYGYFGGITLERRGTQSELGSTHAELYEVDLDTGKAVLISHRASAPDTYRDWLITADGTLAAFLDFESASGSWTLRNAQRKDLARGKAPTGNVELLSLGRTPDSVVYYTRDDAGDDHIHEVPINGGEPVEILKDEAVGRFLTDEHSRLLVGYAHEGDFPEDRFFEKRRDKRMASVRKAFPGATVKLIDANRTFDRLIVRTDGPGDPQSWYVVDLKTGRADQIGSSYALAGRDVGPMRMYRYKAADGLDIGAVLTLPPGREARNLPLVVLPHGGPQSRDYPVFDWWAQAYASRGYAVLQPNFRGSSGLGSAFRTAGQGEWGRRMQTDISDGVAALARDGIVDPRRACIAGASYGGYAALVGVTIQQGLYRCAVSVAGVANVQKMVTTDIQESARNLTVIRALRSEVGVLRDLKAISPSDFAARADAPILLIHGADDIVVPFDQSRLMASALARAGKPHELVRLAGEDHWLSRGETRLAMLKASLAFIEKHNPPDPEPAAATSSAAPLPAPANR